VIVKARDIYDDCGHIMFDRDVTLVFQ